ncbi:MAG: hypothetical protein AB8G15_12835 [Saprospiraceae bacterium]
MKKIILLSIVLLITSVSFAQTQEDAWAEQMKRMEQELLQLMQQMQVPNANGDQPFLMDTLLIQRFDNLDQGNGLSPLDGTTFDLGGMFKLFEQQLQQMDESDLENLQELFEQLQLPPGQFDQGKKRIPEEEATPEKKKKKKRKTYKI